MLLFFAACESLETKDLMKNVIIVIRRTESALLISAADDKYLPLACATHLFVLQQRKTKLNYKTNTVRVLFFHTYVYYRFQVIPTA